MVIGKQRNYCIFSFFLPWHYHPFTELQNNKLFWQVDIFKLHLVRHKQEVSELGSLISRLPQTAIDSASVLPFDEKLQRLKSVQQPSNTKRRGIQFSLQYRFKTGLDVVLQPKPVIWQGNPTQPDKLECMCKKILLIGTENGKFSHPLYCNGSLLLYCLLACDALHSGSSQLCYFSCALLLVCHDLCFQTGVMTCYLRHVPSS